MELYYSATFANVSLATYFTGWGAQLSSTEHPDTTGEFNDATSSFNSPSAGYITFSAESYGIDNDSTSYGFIAGSDDPDGLHYTFNYLNAGDTASPNHTFYGELNYLQFGYEVVTDNGEQSLTNLNVAIEGLDLTSTFTEGHSGSVHSLVYPLMSGDVSGLLSLLNGWLDDYGLSTDSTFADLELAGLAGDISTVGSASATESDLALAA